MPWNVRLATLWLLVLPSVASARWTDKASVGESHFGGTDSHQTPLYEKNHAYFWCDDEVKGERAKAGRIDWVRSNADEYCRHKHRDRDDSWRSRWERSRLTRGCKNQLQIFENRVYRCWDHMEDGGIRALNERVDANRHYEYGMFKRQYEAYVKVILNQADVLKELFEADRDAYEADAAKLTSEADLIAERRERDLARLAEFEAFHQRFVERLAQRERDLAAMTTQFDRALDNDRNDVERVGRWLAEHTRSVNSESITLTGLNALRVEFEMRKASCTLRVCQEGRGKRLLAKLRRHQSITSLMLDEYRSEVERAARAVDHEWIRSKLADNIATISETIGSLESVFDTRADSVFAKPAVCDDYDQLPLLYALRAAAAETTEASVALGAIAGGVRQRISAARAGVEAAIAARNNAAEIHALQGRLVKHLTRGEVAEARLTLVDAEARLALIASHADSSEARDDATQTLASMRHDATGRFSLAGASAMVGTRLARLESAVTVVDDALQGSTDANALLWRNNVYPEICARLGFDPGQEFLRPSLRSLLEVEDFDQRIASAEAILEAFEAGRDGGR